MERDYPASRRGYRGGHPDISSPKVKEHNRNNMLGRNPDEETEKYEERDLAPTDLERTLAGPLYGGYPAPKSQGDDLDGQMDFRGVGPRNFRRSDGSIRDDIHRHLTENPTLDASEILVKVAQGEVTLEGEVVSRHDKRIAEDLCWIVSGVTEVRNELKTSLRLDYQRVE